MDKKEQPKSEFVREQIKNKPKNRRRAAARVGMAALCGLVFAVVFCVVLALFLPLILRRMRTDDGQVAQSQESQDSEESSEDETEETEDEGSVASDEEAESTTVVEVPSEITIDDFQKLQNALYSIGTSANKSIVTITSVVSDTDWFNNSYEREGQGSGAIIGETDDAFLILTEHKVITDASKLTVTFIDDASAPAELLKYDGNTGIAVISVDKSELEDTTISAVSVIEMGSSATVKNGSLVIALGSPLGTNYSILTGNITATNNEISTSDSNYTVFTTDIVANKSGSGILINTDGEMVGVVMQDYAASSTDTLTALAITELEPVIDLLCAGSDVPYVGLDISTVTEKIASEYDIPKGVYIKQVEMDSPAMIAGLQSGDVITSIDGKSVMTDNAYSSEVLGLVPGETYDFTVMRQGSSEYTEITYQVTTSVLK